MKSIQCRIVNADDEEVRAWAAVTEIEENVIGCGSNARAVRKADREAEGRP
jgi:hypothetical protein